MPLHLDPSEDMNASGQERLERDYQTIERRDGGKTSRTDFALGWVACAARFGIWAVFTPAAAARLRGQR